MEENKNNIHLKKKTTITKTSSRPNLFNLSQLYLNRNLINSPNEYGCLSPPAVCYNYWPFIVSHNHKAAWNVRFILNVSVCTDRSNHTILVISLSLINPEQCSILQPQSIKHVYSSKVSTDHCMGSTRISTKNQKKLTKKYIKMAFPSPLCETGLCPPQYLIKYYNHLIQLAYLEILVLHLISN